MANNNVNGGRQVTIVNYRECRRNHATQRGRNAVDGCLEFLKAGDRNREALLCAACGCHRSFHRKEDVPAHVEPGVVQILQQMAAAAAAAPPPAPAANEEENLDLGAGEVDEEVEPERERRRRGRTRLTPPQKEAMREKAEKLEWSLQGHDEEELLHFCLEIGISPQVFKVWMKNNKGKYVVAGETSSAAGGF